MLQEDLYYDDELDTIVSHTIGTHYSESALLEGESYVDIDPPKPKPKTMEQATQTNDIEPLPGPSPGCRRSRRSRLKIEIKHQGYEWRTDDYFEQPKPRKKLIQLALNECIVSEQFDQ